MDWNNLPEVALAKPEDAAVVAVSIEPDHMYVLQFDPGHVNFARSDDADLTVSFDNNSSLVLRDFFSVAEAGEFYLTTQEGDVLSGKDLAGMMLLDLQDIVCEQSGDELGGLLDAAFAGAEAAESVKELAAQGPQPTESAELAGAGLSELAVMQGTALAGTERLPLQDENACMEQFLRSLLL